MDTLSPKGLMQYGLDAQSAAEKNRQEKEQAKYDKAWEDMKSGKIKPPTSDDMGPLPEKKPVKKMAKGGSVGSASKRADGCATKGKTKGRII